MNYIFLRNGRGMKLKMTIQNLPSGGTYVNAKLCHIISFLVVPYVKQE